MKRRYSGLAWVTIAVLAHLIVVVLHGQAHTRLGVGLSYVFVCILGQRGQNTAAEDGSRMSASLDCGSG